MAIRGFGPRRISAELARETWGGIRISENGVWRVLRRFNLNTRNKRLALIARHADPYERAPAEAPKALHIDAPEPGEKVQIDCFYVARLSGSKGVVWQYTAIDVASAYTWAFLRSTDRNPSARHTAELVHMVARELKAAGWRLQQVTTDNGSEFRSKDFGAAIAEEKATQRKVKAGRPNSNGYAERVQLTILEECWRPAFSRSLAPKITALKRDLDEYLHYYNTDRAHTGRQHLRSRHHGAAEHTVELASPGAESRERRCLDVSRAGQRPCHLGLSWPHALQLKTVRGRIR